MTIVRKRWVVANRRMRNPMESFNAVTEQKNAMVPMYHS